VWKEVLLHILAHRVSRKGIVLKITAEAFEKSSAFIGKILVDFFARIVL